MRAIFTMIILLFISGCACTKWAPPPENMTMKTMAVEDDLDAPPLLVVAQWLAFYGQEAIPFDEKHMVIADYPTYGTPVETFVWQFERRTPGLNLPPAQVEGMQTSAIFWVPMEEQEGWRCRVSGVDSMGVQGPWSTYCTFGDTAQAPGVEEE